MEIKVSQLDTKIIIDDDNVSIYTKNKKVTCLARLLDIIHKLLAITIDEQRGKISNLLLDLPIHKPITAVYFKTCCCNGGYCNRITSVDISKTSAKTAREFFEQLYIDPYYHPKLCYLHIDWAEFPKTIHTGSSCCSEKIPFEYDEDPRTCYISASYRI